MGVQGLPSPAAHDDRVGDGQLAETLHVFGQMPRHPPIDSDGPRPAVRRMGLGPNQIDTGRGEIVGIVIDGFFLPCLLGELESCFIVKRLVVTTAATVMLHIELTPCKTNSPHHTRWGLISRGESQAGGRPADQSSSRIQLPNRAPQSNGQIRRQNQTAESNCQIRRPRERRSWPHAGNSAHGSPRTGSRRGNRPCP